MKKTLLLNTALSELIASLGHGDMVVIADAGLPIPPETRRIDLALCRDMPPFLDTVRTVLSEMQVERAIIAEETGRHSPHIRAALAQMLPATPLEEMSHLRSRAVPASARRRAHRGVYAVCECDFGGRGRVLATIASRWGSEHAIIPVEQRSL